MTVWYKELPFEKWIRYLENNPKDPIKRRLLSMSLTDYSELENEIADAPEPKTLPAGAEVRVKIISVRSGVSDKNDCKWYMPVLEVPDDPMIMEFNKFMWELDREKLTPKQYARALNDFQKFATCFGIDYSRPFSWEDDLPGLEGTVIVGVSKSDEYGEQNNVKKMLAPK